MVLVVAVMYGDGNVEVRGGGDDGEGERVYRMVTATVSVMATVRVVVIVLGTREGEFGGR